MQGERPSNPSRIRIRVVLPMALGLFLAGTLLRLPVQGGEELSLRPYLDAPTAGGAVGGKLRELNDAWALGSGREAFRFVLPALSGFACALLFLGLEVFLRRVWRRPLEVAALLAAALFLAMPAGVVFQVQHGGDALLLGLTTLLLAVRVAFLAARLAPLGAITLGLVAVLLHPAMLALLPVVALAVAASLSMPPKVAILALAMVMSAGAGVRLASGEPVIAPPVDPSVGAIRAVSAWTTALAAPVLAFDARPRSLIATGYEALTGLFPVGFGVTILALLGGWAMLGAGIRRAGSLLLATLGAGVLVAWVTPAWVPGDRGPLVIALVPATGLLALLLSIIRGPTPRSVFLGLTVGVVVVAFLVEWKRAGYFWRRTAVLQLPRQGFANGGDVLAPYSEPDAARLYLYLVDISRTAATDPDLGPVAGALTRRLLERRDTMLRPGVIDAEVKRATNHPEAVPPDLKPDQEALFERLLPLERRIPEIRAKLKPGAAADNYELMALEVHALIPDALEICLSPEAVHPRIRLFVNDFQNALARLADLAMHLGDTKNSIPCREALVEITGRDPRMVAILGRELVEAGRPAEAKPLLEEALKRAEPQDLLWAVTLGALGRAKAALGEKREGLAHLNRAWSDLAGASGGGARKLSAITYPEGVDYWLVMEMLLARYELVRELDPELEPQSRHDVERGLEHALGFGVRRIPALMMAGRLKALAGDLGAARIYLREMRAIKTTKIEEKAGGVDGRFDFPRWRRLGLETLRDLLDPVANAAERSEVDTEIAALAGR